MKKISDNEPNSKKKVQDLIKDIAKFKYSIKNDAQIKKLVDEVLQISEKAQKRAQREKEEEIELFEFCRVCFYLVIYY